MLNLPGFKFRDIFFCDPDIEYCKARINNSSDIADYYTLAIRNKEYFNGKNQDLSIITNKLKTKAKNRITKDIWFMLEHKFFDTEMIVDDISANKEEIDIIIKNICKNVDIQYEKVGGLMKVLDMEKYNNILVRNMKKSVSKNQDDFEKETMNNITSDIKNDLIKLKTKDNKKYKKIKNFISNYLMKLMELTIDELYDHYLEKIDEKYLYDDLIEFLAYINNTRVYLIEDGKIKKYANDNDIKTVVIIYKEKSTYYLFNIVSDGKLHTYFNCEDDILKNLK
jgi:hypothetical protein